MWASALFFRIGLLLVDIGKMDRERLAFWLRGKEELYRILEYLMILCYLVFFNLLETKSSFVQDD